MTNRFYVQIIKSILPIASIALITILALPARPVDAQLPPTASHTITVTGVGSTSASPDIAYVAVGVDVPDESVSNGLKQSQMKINTIISALKSMGIADKDIQTIQFNVYETGDPSKPREYHVVNTVRVTVQKIEKVGDLLGKAVNAGANVINSIEFSVKDTRPSETTARQAALDDAKARAIELATRVGGTLGKVVSITENSPYSSVSAGRGYGGGGGGSGPSINAGSLQVTISLTVTYELLNNS